MTRTKYEGMTVPQKRRKLRRRAGVNGDDGTALSKACLNSIVAYLTGELPVEPAFLYRDEAPTKAELYGRVCDEVGLEDWTADYEEKGLRPFNGPELTEVLFVMDKTGDQSAWTPA